jgi:hypothetical protein
MRRRVWVCIACGAFLFHGGLAKAQDSLQALEDDLKEAKQQHDDMTTQALSNFFTQVDAAMGSNDAAVALYQQAGGTLPDPSPVVKANEEETPTEKDARLARDQANITRLGVVLQLHCGLMHYAALFVTKPDQKGLQDDWVAWLKTAAAVYPQLAVPATTDDQPPPQHKKKKNGQEDGAAEPAKPPPPFNPSDMKAKTMLDSIIGKFLGFNLWGDKEQGGWAVKDLPKLYKANVLEPLRATPTAETLAAWDAYIAMANADEPDNDKWSQVVYPPLQFDRACDDYAVTPGTDKLENLVNLIKAYPTYPGTSDWITRTRQLMDDYRTRRGGKAPVAQNPVPAPSAPTTDPNVSVTTVQQGDETIIITHTNSAPVAPAH